MLFLFILLTAPAGTGVFMNKNKHLIYDERHQIEQGLNSSLSFKAIGRDIGRDCTTIAKEVKAHIIFEKKGAPYRPFNDCKIRAGCPHKGDVCQDCTRGKSRNLCFSCGKCTTSCRDYIKEVCPLLDKAPYVCNGCNKLNTCTLEKRFYRAHQAQKEYEEIRSESRSGFNLTEAELHQLDSVISPLLKQGQSLHHILANNPDTISICEKTAYIYADNGLFSAKNIDMPRKVRFRPRRKKSKEMKVDKSCRIGRTLEDFQKYHEENPSIPITELDSVEGKKGGAVLLTIHFVLPKLQLAFLRESNDSKSVTDIFNYLYELLGKDRYKRIFSLCLADNGTEFSNPTAIECDSDGVIRSHVFYCDPSSPGQKGACENNHEFIRRVIPKGIDIGKYTQADINLMMDHINSYGRPELGDKSPYDMFEFYYGKEILDILGVHKIPANDIILKPELLNQRQPSHAHL